MKSKIAITASVTMLTLGFASIAPTAFAAQGDCAAGYTCLWEDRGYQGGSVSFARYIPDLALWKLSNGNKANDTLSSAKQRGKYEATCLFVDKNGGGESRRMGRGTQWYDLTDHSFNDTISSAYFTGYKSC